MEFRTAYERKEHEGIKFTQPTLTQQQFRDECDVNIIIDRYTRTGVIPEDVVRSSVGVYGDFSSGDDFLTMQNQIVAATQSFEALPSKIRDRFNNNPAELIAFVRDKGNYDEAVKLGLIEKVKVEPAAPVPEKGD